MSKLSPEQIAQMVAEVKERLPMLSILERDGIEMRRSGPNFVGLCPFHQEGSPSFTVHGGSPEHAHCYGCGWHGDVFDYRQQRGGGDFLSVLSELASLASVAARGGLSPRKKAASQVTDVSQARESTREKPALPRMRVLRADETEALARLRGLDVGGVLSAARAGFVGACCWPQFLDHRGAWAKGGNASPCWVVTDQERAVAQFRRLDGRPFVRGDGKEIKCWTKGSPTWPIGAREMGDRAAVLLVEGGADLLAAHHFLGRFGRLHAVAVIAMLGASMRIAADALPLFERKRVRIMMDADQPKVDGGVRPGCEAAVRWSGQLTGAGAAVEVFSLDGLLKKDGTRVKDLNDLAAVDEAAWLDPELRAAFFDFDF